VIFHRGRGVCAWARLAAKRRWCHHAAMQPLRLIETTPGQYSLLLDGGTTQVDDLIEELGHEPNGYFWESVVQVLVSSEAPALDGRFSCDSEAGMFCAHGGDEAP
jgi:hypothetical protein